MDPLRIAIRSVLSFFFLLVMTRLSGKRTVADSTAFDFVFALILGDVVDNFLFAEVSAAKFFVCVGTLVFADVLFKLVSVHSNRFHALIDGIPAIVYRAGQPDRSGMKAEQLSESDVAALLRVNGIDEESYSDIKFGIIESSGDMAVLKNDDAKALQKRDRQKLTKKTD